MTAATGTEGDFRSRGWGVGVGARILKSSPSLSTVGKSKLSNGPPYHVNRKEALAKTAWFLCISNISNFIKIFPTMHLRVRN